MQTDFSHPGRLHSRGATALLAVALVLTGCYYVGPLSSPSHDAENTTLLWAGGVTDSSARVVARPPAPPEDLRLALSRSGTWDDPVFVGGTPSATNDRAVHFELEGLAPRTTYHYALAPNGRVDTSRSGRFQTFGTDAFSYRVALGACARTGSNHPVFGKIRAAAPDLFLPMGDMHYEDITATRPGPFRAAYRQVHSSPRQSALFRSTALAYMWDDHDYGPNNSSRQAPGQDVSQQVYREYVPHYPLAADDQAAPIHQAFTMGRVRFLLTDLRSARTRNDAPDSVKTMMGARQKAWFKDQLRRARDRYPVIAWVSSVPWIGDDSTAEDRWAGFARERRELATYIDSIGVADQLVILSGDAHMVALNDGTHNHYGREGGGGFPVVHAAALDQVGSVKGGPYTHGPYPNPFPLFGRTEGQFVLMDVRDRGGDEVCISWTGRRHDPGDEEPVTLMEWEKCFPALS